MISLQPGRDAGTVPAVPPSTPPGAGRREGRDDLPAPASSRPTIPGAAPTGTVGGDAGAVPAGTIRPGAPGTVPAALTLPRPRTGGRPRVWTRDSRPPGRDVQQIFDGVSSYRRTAADRWVPDGQGGPGFGWTEIPAALRVDVTGGHRTGPDGALIMAVPDTALAGAGAVGTTGAGDRRGGRDGQRPTGRGDAT